MALVDSVLVMGSGLTYNVRQAITKAGLNGSLSEVTQLEMTLIDQGWSLLGSGLFVTGMRVEVGGFQLEIANIETGEDSGVENFTLRCRPIIVRRLKDRRGPRVMVNVSPSEFVVSECVGVGANYIVQPSARRSQVSRDVPQQGEQEVRTSPSSWTTFQRLARELGFVVFEAAGTIFFGKPSWLIYQGNLPLVSVNYRTGELDYKRSITVPKCKRSLDDPAITVETSVIVRSVDEVRAGKLLRLNGVPTFNGDYIISSFDIDLLMAINEASISATTPIDPAPR